MIFYNNFLQIFNEKQELFYSVLLYFCDSVFVFQCLCFLVIVQKCALVPFSHDLPSADGEMAKLPMAQNGKIGQMGQMGQMGNSHCSNFGLKTQTQETIS